MTLRPAQGLERVETAQMNRI